MRDHDDVPNRLLLLVLVLLVAGCATPGGRALSAPVPLTAEEQAVVADLMRIEDERSPAVGPVLEAAGSQSPAVRARAALSLGRLRAPAGRDILIEVLQDADTAVAATAAFALGQLGDSAAAPALSHVLDTAGPQRVTAAAEAAYALGKLRGVAAAGALASFLATTPIRSGAAPEPVSSALLATWRHPRPDDLGFITRWTAAPDPEIRWRAAYALVRRPAPAAATILRGLTSDPDARVRSMAVRGLAFPLADSAGIAAEALPILRSAAGDPDYTVRINAVRALGGYSDPSAVEAMTALATGEDHHLAITALESLGRLGASARSSAPTLREISMDGGRPAAIRQWAIEALSRIDSAVATTTANGLMGDPEWRVRVGAVRALARQDLVSDRIESLRPLLRSSGDARVAAAALQALTEVAGDSLAPLRTTYVEALGSGDLGVRVAALAGLTRLADPSTLPLVLDAYDRALRDEENDARLGAIDAIAALRREGSDPARAFFARFPRSDDYLVRLRAVERFGDPAARWGDPLPLDPGTVDHAALLASAQPSNPSLRVRIETDRGVVDLELAASEAPLTVRNFLSLAQAGFFDGQEWPRVVPNFVVQGGDPRGDTSGGPGYSIRDEFNRLRYGTGTLGMALSGPDTGGSQWFITHSPQPHLDGAYTVFGRVIAGQDVTERIVPGDRILRIHVIP
jgi:cyclophilin family peptidyl-prolyl cis-trans isomerase/HEAT repeat protein